MRAAVLTLMLLAFGCGSSPDPTPPQACSLAYPRGACQSYHTCHRGNCCPDGKICGDDCCSAGSACVGGLTTYPRCTPTCKTDGDCPAAKPCCVIAGATLDRNGICEARGERGC